MREDIRGGMYLLLWASQELLSLALPTHSRHRHSYAVFTLNAHADSAVVVLIANHTIATLAHYCARVAAHRRSGVATHRYAGIVHHHACVIVVCSLEY